MEPASVDVVMDGVVLAGGHMLRNQWYAICLDKQVGNAPLGLRRFGRPLVLWRDNGGPVQVAFDACPHRGAALSRGRVRDGCIECPYHGLRFATDGSCTRVPAHPNDPIPPDLALSLQPTQQAHGVVWVWNGPGEPTALPWDDTFQASLIGDDNMAFQDLQDSFDVSYLRVMENLTDLHHVAHVHRWTAPVPPDITAFSAVRDGRDVRVTAELGGSLSATVHLRAPFLGLLTFNNSVRFAVIATPIDDNHVWLFARYGQSAVRFPGLSTFLTWVLGQVDYRLLQRLQDVPVWRSQRLERPDDIHRYHLLPADQGIQHYFDIHEELKANS